MPDVNSPAFRSVLGGFNKKDVTDYIAKLNRDFSEQLASREREIKALNEKLEEAQELAVKASEAGDRENTEELERANKLIASQNEQLEILTAKQKELEEELAVFKSKLDSYTAIDSKVSKYEEMTSRMGEIYVDAAADADRIRKEARDEADRLKTEAEEYCRTKRAETDQKLRDFTENGKKSIEKLLEATNRQIAITLDNFEINAAGAIQQTASDIFSDKGCEDPGSADINSVIGSDSGV